MPVGSYIPVEQLAAIAKAHRAERGPAARIAFVLPPGGAAGAYQAGALTALHEHGVHADLIIGISSGALNGLGHVLDALAVPLTRGTWPRSRLGRMWRHLSHRQRGSRLLVDKPFLIGWMAGRPHWNRDLLGGLMGQLPTLRAALSGPGASAFRSDHLRRLVTGAIARALGETAMSPALAGRTLVDSWALQHESGRRLPTLIVLATEVESHQAVPFVLGDPAVAERLFRLRHPVRALGHGHLTEASVVEALVASATIPGAFPAVELPSERPGGAALHYVDGAVSASEPFHLAIDAGATLVISLEVAPFEHHPRPGPGGPRHPLALAADSLMAIQERYLRADARGLASWNWRVSADSAVGRLRVPLYRLAPVRQQLGLLDFDGHYQGGELVMSLFDSFMRGYGDAGGNHPIAWGAYAHGQVGHGDTGCAMATSYHPGFWEATLKPSPGRLPVAIDDVSLSVSSADA